METIIEGGTIVAVCASQVKGVAKEDIGRGEFLAEHGLVGDAHAGKWHRQVSLLSADKVEAFRQRGAEVKDGAFGENILVKGIDLAGLPVGTFLRCGQVLLEVTQIGKECHAHCAIYAQVGDCIMPREGIFARVHQGGSIDKGDRIYVENSLPRSHFDSQ